MNRVSHAVLKFHVRDVRARRARSRATRNGRGNWPSSSTFSTGSCGEAAVRADFARLDVRSRSNLSRCCGSGVCDDRKANGSRADWRAGAQRRDGGPESRQDQGAGEGASTSRDSRSATSIVAAVMDGMDKPFQQTKTQQQGGVEGREPRRREVEVLLRRQGGARGEERRRRRSARAARSRCPT